MNGDRRKRHAGGTEQQTPLEAHMNNETQHVESGNSPPTEIRESEARASRIHSLLKLRDKAEAEIATVLREHLASVGEPAWLEWCEREFGWKRTAAYRHLNPKLMQKHREDAEAERSHGGNIAESEAKRASPDLIEKWREVWTSLNVTEEQVIAVERASAALQAVQKRVLDVYPKHIFEIGPAAPMSNLESVGTAFRHLFETKGIGNGSLAAPTGG